jgi:hypothetical protein
LELIYLGTLTGTNFNINITMALWAKYNGIANVHGAIYELRARFVAFQSAIRIAF